MGATETLARYASAVKLEDFPAEPVLQAKHFIQNEIGCALGGAQTELGKRTIAVAREIGVGGKGEATLIGDGARMSCVLAAHANTELAETLDFDDEHKFTLTHPSCSIVSTALAVGEMTGASGKEMLAAVLGGYEVGLRIARSMRSIVTAANGKDEVMSIPAYVAFAAAATAGRLLALDAEKMENAFGMVGSTPINRGQSRVHLGAAGPHPYTDNKFDMGMYSVLGIMNAVRARALAGPKGILDGDRFSSRVSANRFDLAELTRGLGQEFRIMEMSFKPACFCAVVFCQITAIWDALKGEKINPKDIEEIKITGIPKLEFKQWENMVQAEFSSPCAVAMAVSGDEPGPDWYSTGRYKAPEIMEIASKVTFAEDPRARPLALEKGQWICSADIRTKDGKLRHGFCEKEKGSPGNPLTEDELRHKFITNSKGILGDKKSQKLWETLLNVEQVKKVKDLGPMLAK